MSYSLDIDYSPNQSIVPIVHKRAIIEPQTNMSWWLFRTSRYCKIQFTNARAR